MRSVGADLVSLKQSLLSHIFTSHFGRRYGWDVFVFIDIKEARWVSTHLCRHYGTINFQA
jgi:hypothetical protein